MVGQGSLRRDPRLYADRLRAFVARARRDPLTRTTGLLVADNVGLSVVGAICTVLMARLWAPQAVGTVAAITGALNIVVIAAALGMPTMIVRFLADEARPGALLRQALIVAAALAAGAGVALAVLPGHLGVPLARLHVSEALLAALLVVYVVSLMVVTIGDPSYIARQEVSFMVAKDAAASVIRIVMLLVLSASGATTLFLAMLVYVVAAGVIDLGLLTWRLRRAATGAAARGPRFAPLRRRFSFAIGIHVALIASSTPAFTLPALTAALVGARESAFVAVALQVGSVLTLIPTQTGQSLLAELARRPDDLLGTTLRALRGSYSATLPIAAFVAITAPWILLVFGHSYSAHGTSFVRWSAAGSVFFVFNYAADVVLLARQKVRAYVLVNVLGTICFLTLIVVSLQAGFHWLGPAWLTAQALYAGISGVVVLRYAGRDDVRAAWAALRARLPGA